MISRSVLVAAVCLAGAQRANGAVDPEANTDGFSPATEIYRINEARRQDQIARQLDLNFRMQSSAGLGPRFANPFEPWPRVPGDIWGYPLARPVAQPIGHESVQTSPNRWIYRPLYATAPGYVRPRSARPAARSSVPVAPRQPPPAHVQLPGPSEPEPEDFAPRGPNKRKPLPAGAREF
jgi:hypothetical protein